MERILDHAARRGVKELLVLTGDDPGHHPGVRARLAELGLRRLRRLRERGVCERGLERGLLPHTNLGALSHDDVARLRRTAKPGGHARVPRPDLVAHQGSPTKAPALRLATIAAAEALRVPFTSGILVGIGRPRRTGMAALEALAGFFPDHHLQEVILQNFVPHRRYYGEEPAEIAYRGRRAYWRTGLARPHVPAPLVVRRSTVDDRSALVREARRLMPEVGIQIPPNLADWWPRLSRAGATDLGGLRQRRPHLPRAPVPVAAPGAQAPRGGRDRAHGAAVRLPRFIDPEWIAQGVLDVIKARDWSFIRAAAEAA